MDRGSTERLPRETPAPEDYYELTNSQPPATCVGCQAWSKAQGSESCPVGVRRFKSCPTHLVETGCGRCHPAPLLDIGSRGPNRGASRGLEDHLNSRVESVSGGHRLQRHPGGRQSDQVRGGTSCSPNVP